MKKPTKYITENPSHLLPDLEEWPINILNNRRTSFVEKIVDETTKDFISDKSSLIDELQVAAQLEDRRIKTDPWSVDPPNELAFWKSITKTLRAVDQLPEDNEQRQRSSEEAMRRVVTVYAEEICGKFKPSMFRAARKFCKVTFSILFNKFSDGPFGFWGKHKDLAHKMRLQGPVDLVRSLFEHGTIVFVPTHSSNLDSLLIGFVIDQYMGIPSAHYGAGLNLYNSEIAGYFMNRMGAYRVDRRKKNRIYLETLKSTSRIAMRLGVNSLFFPGGTRSRSGELEQTLKLGLLGTTVEAQRQLLQEDSNRKVFIVPLIISYPNVLEDSSMYRNFLHRQGLAGLVKKRLKRKNSFLKACRFLGQTFKHEMVNYISIGQPMDVFGNQVNENGHSLDKQGNRVSKREYFLKDGKVTKDEQREMQYTRHLASLVAASYRESNVVRLSQLCASAFLQALWSLNKINTAEATLKLASSEWSVPTQAFLDKFEGLIQMFREYASDGLCLIEDAMHEQASNELLLREGVKQLRTYQFFSVLNMKSETVETDHIGLIMYYANRLECYFAYQRQL